MPFLMVRIKPRHFFLAAIVVALVPGFVSAAKADNTGPDASGRLRLAICQFPISADISKNARRIRGQIQQAKQKNADLVHFPETALSGYARDDHKTLDNLDWGLLRHEMQSIMALAEQTGLWVVLPC